MYLVGRGVGEVDLKLLLQSVETSLNRLDFGPAASSSTGLLAVVFVFFSVLLSLALTFMRNGTVRINSGIYRCSLFVL